MSIKLLEGYLLTPRKSQGMFGSFVQGNGTFCPCVNLLTRGTRAWGSFICKSR